MTWFITAIVLWMVSAPVTYVIIRRDQIATLGKWKRVDRVATLGLSLVYGPLALIIIGAVIAVTKFAASGWANKEVRW